MNLPAREEGEHWCLGHLVKNEAQKMIDAQPYTGGAAKHYPEDLKRAKVEEQLWRWLGNGWTRLRDDGQLVHWHPDAEDWVPFTKHLHEYYTDIGTDLITWYRHLAEQCG